MTERVGVGQVESRLNEFKKLLHGSIQQEIALSPLYRCRSTRGAQIDWPANWESAWGRIVQSGIYLHFDEDDVLLYVGKAVSVPSRLTAYYAYADRHSDKSCRVVHRILDEANGCGVRAIGLDGDLRFLGPALEWYLIHYLNPPLNTQGRNWFPAES